MNYNPATDTIEVKVGDAKRAYFAARSALRHIRSMAGLRMDRYKKGVGPLEDDDFAQIEVIRAMEALGINMGVGHMEYNELDLRGDE